ncbi:MAG TPA: hypothetical protein VLR49_14890, partial [Ferruginibacter sp.]|nr:hypothetical protein [Ferruginibacter sp.]
MKKLLLLTAIILIVTSVSFAQTQKGNWLVGGSAEFSSQKTGDFNNTTLSFQPAAGYFVANDVAVGAGLGFASSKDEGEDAVTAFSFAPFVRYYFAPLGPGAKLFVNGSFGVGSGGSVQPGTGRRAHRCTQPSASTRSRTPSAWSA